MKKTALLLLLSTLLLFACNPPSDSIKIQGTIKGFEGNTIYAKKVDALNHNGNSILDSATVNEQGQFEFEIQESFPLLLNLSKYDRQHPVHQVLQESPETYYYGYCALFYVPEPTLYLTEATTIDLDWTVKSMLDSFTFKYPNVTYQEQFYNFYLTEKLSEGLYLESGDYKPMEIEEAWTTINQAINETLNDYELYDNKEMDTFNHYLYTEIQMGAMNQYMNWFETIHHTDLQLAFTNGEIPPLYTAAFDLYSENKWNTQSVEFFKMTERFVTFNLNKSHRQIQDYYPSSEEKVAMAEKILIPEIVDQYVSNLKL